MCYRVGKRRKGLLRRDPVERTHREIVVFSVPYGKLVLVVIEGIEFVQGVKILIIFSVASLDLAIMSGSIRFDQFMLDAKLLQRFFKESFPVGTQSSEPVCELRSVVRLNTFNGIRETLYAMPDEL